MLSEKDEQALSDICTTFINSGDNVTLAHLLDFVTATIPDTTSPEWKSWTKYMERLNETWRQKNIDGEAIPWPEPPIQKKTSDSEPEEVIVLDVPIQTGYVRVKISDKESKSVPATEVLAFVKQLAADRKIGGQGVGPIRQQKSISTAKRPGKRRDELVDKLIIEVEEPYPKLKAKKRDVVYCVACYEMAVGRNPQRVKDHAKNCGRLARDFPHLHKDVIDNLAGSAHSTQLGKGQQAAGTIHEYMHPTKLADYLKTKIEWLMFRMFICCALPWALMDNQFFTEFVHALAPNFTIPDRSAFFPKHLAQETAVWGKEFKKFIADKTHLTISLDGWSSRAKDEIYTFHTTTTKRRSFFTDGHVFKGESVTGMALFDVLDKLLQTYGPENYSAIAGDGGPNVRAAKIKIVAKYKWIINIYDPCHNLNLFMKDVGKLFKTLLSIVAAIANYFGKSNYGTYHLDEERRKSGISEGIKSHSETRFSSSYYQVLSVHTCMEPIKKCYKSNTLKFDTAATKKLRPYIDGSPTHHDFMGELSCFIQLCAPIANSLLTLEGQNTTCADVFYIWVCIAYHLEQVTGASYLAKYRPSVIEAYNHRFQQMMTESSHRVFLLSYFLHPLFRHHGGLQLTMPVLKDGETLKPAQYPALFKKLLSSVLEIFKNEQICHKDSGKEVVPKLIEQLIAYAYNKAPYNSKPWTRKTKPLKWWKEVSADSNANLLARIAIKLFSISPSEICDERTASKLGWFNPALRSSMTPEHLVDSAKLYDYYTKGFEDGKSTHQARVHIPATPITSSAPRIQSAPTILDLLNAENVEPKDMDFEALEDELFNQPDPYDLAETDRADTALEGVQAPQASEPVVRSSTRFNIAEYIKLDDDKLKALLLEVDIEGPGAALPSELMEVDEEVTNTPGDWSIESFLEGGDVKFGPRRVFVEAGTVLGSSGHEVTEDGTVKWNSSLARKRTADQMEDDDEHRYENSAKRQKILPDKATGDNRGHSLELSPIQDRPSSAFSHPTDRRTGQSHVRESPNSHRARPQSRQAPSREEYSPYDIQHSQRPTQHDIPALDSLLRLDTDAFVRGHLDAYDQLVHKWSSCTLAEWSAGADEIASQFCKILDYVKDYVTDKVKLYGDLHGDLDKHNVILDERNRDLSATKKKLIQDSGSFLGR